MLLQILFILLIALSAAASEQNARLAREIRWALPFAGFTAAGLGALFVATGKASTSNSATAALSARPFALFAVIALAWALANVRFRKAGYLLGAATLGLMLFTLSRSSLAAAALMFSVNWLTLVKFTAWLKTAAAIVVVVIAGLVAVRDIPSLHDRFYRGDVTSIVGFRINTEGRSQLWRLVWDRYVTSPIIGHGAGDSTRNRSGRTKPPVSRTMIISASSTIPV